MANTLTKPQKSLFDYILQIGLKPVKCASNKGFMLYTIPTIEQINQLSELVDNLNSSWTLIQSDEQWNKGNKTKDASIYIGHAVSKNDIKSIDDFVALDF